MTIEAILFVVNDELSSKEERDALLEKSARKTFEKHEGAEGSELLSDGITAQRGEFKSCDAFVDWWHGQLEELAAEDGVHMDEWQYFRSQKQRKEKLDSDEGDVEQSMEKLMKARKYDRCIEMVSGITHVSPFFENVPIFKLMWDTEARRGLISITFLRTSSSVELE